MVVNRSSGLAGHFLAESIGKKEWWALECIDDGGDYGKWSAEHVFGMLGGWECGYGLVLRALRWW